MNAPLLNRSAERFAGITSCSHRAALTDVIPFPLPRRLVILLAALLSTLVSHLSSASVIDTLAFGDAASEKSHALTADHSESVIGGLGQPARILQSLAPVTWQGGSVAFIVKVDPEKQTYVTARLWGSDATSNCLILFCDGKQVGYRHLGDVEILDVGGGAPAFNGRFFYVTTPLPIQLTHGKTEVRLEIRSSGPIWGYGTTFAKFQLEMSRSSRGIYAITTHTNPYFSPPVSDKQGEALVHAPARPQPGSEVLDMLKQRVDGEIKRLLASTEPLKQMQLQFLAQAYHVTWTSAYHNANAVSRAVQSLDALFFAYRKNPKLAEADPNTYNAEWFGLGPAGNTLRLLAEPLSPFFDQLIEDPRGGSITRRAAFSEMLQRCRDWHRRHRRLYTNQTMINDLYGIYLANRGIAVLTPAAAMPEAQVRRYLYESVGLEVWRGSDAGGEGPVENGGRAWGVGAEYWQLTNQALSRELGYVGYYGEVLDWVASIYDATRPAPGAPGDESIRAQLARMERARGVFRYPAVDGDGFRAMRIEAIVGWRDSGHYPGDVAYGERMTWDGSALYAAATTLEPESVGYAQQMFEDNQFFALLKEHMKQNSFRVTAGLLGVPDQYDRIKAQPASAHRLPMTPGQPDSVFTDEVDGVVALKDGEATFYASLYWRARYAINFLARVHYTTPTVDHIAVVREDVQFQPSGESYTRPDHAISGFGNGGPGYPVQLHSAHACEVLPIAKIPRGVSFKAGQESVYAGRGDFYTLSYGPYLIGMNMSEDRTFDLKVPSDASSVRNLGSGKSAGPGARLSVAPRSTVVLKVASSSTLP